MRDFLSQHERLVAGFLALTITSLLIFLDKSWSANYATNTFCTFLYCAIVPTSILFFVVWLAKKTIKAVTDTGQIIHRRKNHLDYEWTPAGELLKPASDYSLGDDGELIEIPNTDEERKHDDTRH